MAEQRKRIFTHLDAKGRLQMVDVSGKRATRRVAAATAVVRMSPETLKRLKQGRLPKGDVLAVARLAAITAAKEASRIIPLCHGLPLEAIDVGIDPAGRDRLTIRVTAATTAKTGVEMEALTGAAAAALTIYDMCKAVDRGMVIGPIQLEEKSGGRSGTYRRGRS